MPSILSTTAVRTRCARGRTCFQIVLLTALAAIAAGCNGKRADPAPPPPTDLSNRAEVQRMQGETMSFADRYMTAMADVYTRVAVTSKTPGARSAALQYKLLAGSGAMENAVDPSPVVGLMDMALMVNLTWRLSQQPWAAEAFGADSAREITAALKSLDTEVWGLVAAHVSPAQIVELHHLAEQWIKENPGRRYVASARLADFPQAKAAGQNFNVVNTVFGLVKIDPFGGLDPAVRQVEESRILAERMFFYMRHMPLLMSWQVDLLYGQMLAAPQVTKLLADTTTVAGNTTRFSDATTRFSDATTRFTDYTGQFAKTIENFRRQLPDQQSTLVNQLNTLVATQREAAVNQATTQLSTQTETTVKQLNSSVTTQQDLMARNLQAITNATVDRLYARVRNIILIAVAAIFAAFLLYRTISTTAFRKRR